MPKVVDAARVTVNNDAVWRCCAGCGRLTALPPDADRCPACQPPGRTSRATDQASGWAHARRYAGVLGRIEAWAHIIPDVSDAERVAHIREALADFAAKRARGWS